MWGTNKQATASDLDASQLTTSASVTRLFTPTCVQLFDVGVWATVGVAGAAIALLILTACTRLDQELRKAGKYEQAKGEPLGAGSGRGRGGGGRRTAEQSRGGRMWTLLWRVSSCHFHSTSTLVGCSPSAWPPPPPPPHTHTYTHHHHHLHHPSTTPPHKPTHPAGAYGRWVYGFSRFAAWVCAALMVLLALWTVVLGVFLSSWAAQCWTLEKVGIHEGGTDSAVPAHWALLVCSCGSKPEAPTRFVQHTRPPALTCLVRWAQGTAVAGASMGRLEAMGAGYTQSVDAFAKALVLAANGGEAGGQGMAGRSRQGCARRPMRLPACSACFGRHLMAVASETWLPCSITPLLQAPCHRHRLRPWLRWRPPPA